MAQETSPFTQCLTLCKRASGNSYILQRFDRLAEVRLDAVFGDAKSAQVLVIGLAAVVQGVGNTLAGAKIIKNI